MERKPGDTTYFPKINEALSRATALLDSFRDYYRGHEITQMPGNVNKIVEKALEDVLRNINQVPEAVRTAVRNNGGGHANHTMFWEIMKPGGGEPSGHIVEALDVSFGSIDSFKDQFSKAAMGRFGSGWAWLVRLSDGRLAIESTANQDNPLMEGKWPVCGLDVWEHAYYLKYQNRRADYVGAWWNVVNWAEIGKRLQSPAGQKKMAAGA